MSQLFFWNKDESLAWVQVEGATLVSQGDCLPSQLPKLKPYREATSVIYLLTNQAFYVRKVSLFDKKISQQKALEILPLMLEDDFLNDVEDMICFPLDVRKKDADVVVFAKKDWRSVVTFLNESDIACNKILPAVALLPDWACVNMEELALIKTPTVAFCAPWDKAKPMLAQAVAQSIEPPEVLYTTEDDFWQALAIKPLKTQQPWWLLMSERLDIVPHDLSELLEGQSLTKESQTFVVYNLAFLVSLLLAIGFGFKWYHLNALHHKHEFIQNEIKDHYLKLYPDAKSVVAPKTRMQRELGTGNNNPDQFLNLLGIVGQMRAKVGGIDIESIVYEQGVLKLSVKAKNYESVAQLVEQINKKVQAEQKRTTQQDGLVKAQIEVKP